MECNPQILTFKRAASAFEALVTGVTGGNKEQARQLAEQDIKVLSSRYIGKNAATLVDLLGGDEEAQAVVAQCPRILAVRDLQQNVQALAELMNGDKGAALEVLRSKANALMDQPGRMKAARLAGYSPGSQE